MKMRLMVLCDFCYTEKYGSLAEIHSRVGTSRYFLIMDCMTLMGTSRSGHKREFKSWFSNQMNKEAEKFYLTHTFSNCLQKSACDCSGHEVQPTYMCSIIIFNPQSHFTQKEMKHLSMSWNWGNGFLLAVFCHNYLPCTSWRLAQCWRFSSG